MVASLTNKLAYYPTPMIEYGTAEHTVWISLPLNIRQHTENLMSLSHRDPLEGLPFYDYCILTQCSETDGEKFITKTDIIFGGAIPSDITHFFLEERHPEDVIYEGESPSTIDVIDAGVRTEDKIIPLVEIPYELSSEYWTNCDQLDEIFGCHVQIPASLLDEFEFTQQAGKVAIESYSSVFEIRTYTLILSKEIGSPEFKITIPISYYQEFHNTSGRIVIKSFKCSETDGEKLILDELPTPYVYAMI